MMIWVPYTSVLSVVVVIVSNSMTAILILHCPGAALWQELSKITGVGTRWVVHKMQVTVNVSGVK